MLDNAPIYGDIRAFIDSGRCDLYRGVTDIVTAGFPCQPFSVAGNREASNDERNMWPATMDVIKRVKPALCFLENVPGLLSATVDNESDGLVYYFGEILRDLAEGGYDAKWCVLGADDVGAIHRRKRLWIFATNSELYKRGNCEVKNEKGKWFAGTSSNKNLSFNEAGDTKSKLIHDSRLESPEHKEQSEPEFRNTDYSSVYTHTKHNGSSAAKKTGINETDVRNNQKGQKRTIESEGVVNTESSCGKANVTKSGRNRTQGKSKGLHSGKSPWGENIRRIKDIEKRSDIPEPLLRRMDDGMACELDFIDKNPRLKAVGNGQCPQTVVEAFNLLAWHE